MSETINLALIQGDTTMNTYTLNSSGRTLEVSPMRSFAIHDAGAVHHVVVCQVIEENGDDTGRMLIDRARLLAEIPEAAALLEDEQEINA